MPANPVFTFVSGNPSCGSVAGNTLTTNTFCNSIWRLNYRGTVNVVASYSNVALSSTININGTQYQIIGTSNDTLINNQSFNKNQEFAYYATRTGSQGSLTTFFTFTPPVYYTHIFSSGDTASESCESTNSITLYSEDETLVSGSILYLDTGLNDIYNSIPIFLSNGTNFYLVQSGTVQSGGSCDSVVTTTTTTTSTTPEPTTTTTTTSTTSTTTSTTTTVDLNATTTTTTTSTTTVDPNAPDCTNIVSVVKSISCSNGSLTVTYADVQGCSVSNYNPFNKYGEAPSENEEIKNLKEQLSNIYKTLEIYGITIIGNK